MPFKKCEAPYTQYEISDNGEMRRIERGNKKNYYRHNLQPSLPAKGRVPSYSLEKDDGRYGVRSIARLMEKYWPEVDFEPTEEWLAEVRGPMISKEKVSGKQKTDDMEADNLKLPTGVFFVEREDNDIDWRDANYNPFENYREYGHEY